MLIEQQPAYVLHARPYRETSLLLEVLSRDHGRLGVVARGVRGARSRLQRAQLEPFQRLQLDLQLRGELAALRGVDPTGVPLRLLGQAGLAGLYVNELVVRLTARQDPHPDLFEAYAHLLPQLATPLTLAWQLRRFERDLLGAVGYALQLEHEVDHGKPLDPVALYRYHPGDGPRLTHTGAAQALTGADLLALAQDRQPDEAALRGLRRMMREVIRFHLGGDLRAWQVLAAALSRG